MMPRSSRAFVSFVGLRCCSTDTSSGMLLARAGRLEAALSGRGDTADAGSEGRGRPARRWRALADSDTHRSTAKFSRACHFVEITYRRFTTLRLCVYASSRSHAGLRQDGLDCPPLPPLGLPHLNFYFSCTIFRVKLFSAPTDLTIAPSNHARSCTSNPRRRTAGWSPVS